MSKLLQFHNPRKRRQEACDWIARMDAGLSDADRAALTRWLAESPRHAEALLEMSRLWDEMEVMTELAGLFPLKPSPAEHRPPRIRYRAAFAGAVLAAVTLAGAWTLHRLKLPADIELPQARTGIYQPSSSAHTSQELEDGTWIHETAIGAQGSVQLPDGSSVALNTNTRIAVEYSLARRVILLERGEATFDVAPETARPFDVHAGNRIVRALGTIFNVQLGPDDEVEVAVTEGRVRVLRSDIARPVLIADAIDALPIERVLLAGDAYFTNDAMSTIRKLEPEDIDVKLAWQRGMLIFRGEPLAVVLREVGRYTTTDFELADPALADIRVGGYFQTGEIDRLLVALRANFGIQATHVGSTVVLAAP